MKGGPPYWLAIRTFLAEAIDSNSKFPSSGTALRGSSESTLPASNVSAGGGETDTKSGIPIMPNRFFGMVKEAFQSDKRKSPTSSSSGGGGGGKKEL
jgi:hypothetical protein